jgi:hypothetical protein
MAVSQSLLASAIEKNWFLTCSIYDSISYSICLIVIVESQSLVAFAILQIWFLHLFNIIYDNIIILSA